MKKPAFFRVLFTAILALLVVSQPGCKKDKTEPEPEPDIIIAENTKVISDQDWNSKILSVDSTDFTLTFNSGINTNYNLEVGDVIVSSVGYGLLRKITNISASGQNIIVSTEQASLADAILKGELKFEVDVSNPQKIKRIVYQAKGVRFITPKDGDDTKMLLEISTDFGTDFFTMTGELEIDQFEFEGDYAWHWGTWHPVLDKAHGNFSINETFTLTEELSGSAELDKSIKLLKLEYPPITVMIGPVPVIITPEVVLTAGIELEAKSSLSAGLIQELTASGGASYDGNNWHPSFNLEKDFGITPPLLTNSLSAKVYVKPQLNMVIYEVFKPNVSVQPYALLEAEIGNTPWWYFYLGLRSDIGLNIDLVFWDLLDYEASLFDKQFEIANSGDEPNYPPEASFIVSPEGGGMGTNFHFDASGCQDEEDATEDLQVRWDWESDGTWDTEYSVNKEASHAYTVPGSYNVKLEVKDTEGATDKATQQVNVTNNNAPVAVFNVSPASGAIGTVFYFDYSESHDEEDGLTYLEFRWDWEGDGIWDTEFEDYDYDEKTHIYTQAGDYNVKLQVKDTDGAIGDAVQIVTVLNSHAPVASFTIDPQTGNTATVFTFDASGSSDEEDPVEVLQVRWNWDGDTEWDTDWNTNKVIEHQYSGAGTKVIKLMVKDSDGYTNITSRELEVEEFDGVPCPGIPTVTYGGQVYHTVLIGDQCWFKENLNIGTRIPVSNAQTDNGVIEKYCYEDDENYCDIYGALYQWNELMQYIETPGSQGLCPEGWHVPTDGGWKVLEGTVDSLYGVGDPEWDNTGYRGFDAGLNLKSIQMWFSNGAGIDKHGFTVLPAGYTNINTGNSYKLGKEGRFWTSTEGNNSGTAFYRKFEYTHDQIHRYSYSVYVWFGYSVRCLKDQ